MVRLHTKETLLKDLRRLSIDPQGTLLVHSSMKSIGTVEGGADTVLDVLIEYMQDGLLVLPTHTWKTVNPENPRYYQASSSVCVGILPELFRQRAGVVRSLHPTHSVGALGRDSAAFAAGDELCASPCPRHSTWGKLVDREAAIMLIGVDLTRCTFIHGVEEWAGIPNRLAETPDRFVVVRGDGVEFPVSLRRHQGVSSSEHFWKAEPILELNGALHKGYFGDALTRICLTRPMTDLLLDMLAVQPDLFSDDSPLPGDFVPLFLPRL